MIKRKKYLQPGPKPESNRPCSPERRNNHYRSDLNGILFSKKVIHSSVTEKAGKSVVWIGITQSEWGSSDVGGINAELEKTLHNFGVKFYQNKIQLHIDEARQAGDSVAREKRRLTVQATDFGFSLQNHEKEKLSLKKSLASNKTQNTTLLPRIEQNKKAQDSLANAETQIQKVKAAHEETQRKVQ